MGGRGSGGRQKSAKLRAIDGSRVRPHHHRQPAPVDGEPVKPTWLTPEEAGVWDELATILRGQRRLTVDAGLWLTATATQYASWLKTRALASKVQPGDKQFYRAIGTERLQAHALLTHLKEGGLTPSSISRVVMPKAQDESDEFDRFLTAVK